MEDLLSPQHAEVIVDAAFANELILGCIPEGIVGFGVVPFLKGVLIFSWVGRVFGQGALGPIGERFVAVVVRILDTGVEADFSPGCQLIEQSLTMFSHAPKAVDFALGLLHALWVPVLGLNDGMEEFMGADMSEVKVWGKLCGSIGGVGFIAGRIVFGVSLGHEVGQVFLCGDGTADEWSDANAMIDGEDIQRLGAILVVGEIGHWPSGEDIGRKGR